MSFRHSSSISSEDEYFHRRLKSSIYRDGYDNDYFPRFHSANRHEQYIPYEDDQRRRAQNKSKILNITRSRRLVGDTISPSSETESEDETEYCKFDRWRNPLNGSRSRRSRSYHSAIDVYRACEVTINYRKDSSSSSIDQISIKQKPNDNSERVLVYKGYLNNDERFSFKSQRFGEYPFDVKFFVNGRVQHHLISCCEYKYRRGGFRLNQSFFLVRIDKSYPCPKCRRRELKQNGESPLNSSLSDHRLLRSKQVLAEKSTNNDLHSRKSTDRNNAKEDEAEEVRQSEKENGEDETNDSEKKGEEGNSSSRIGQMLAQRSGSDGSSGGNFFQSLLAFLQNGFRQMEVREPLPARHQGNVENFVVLLLGISDRSHLLRSMFNFVKTFENVEELHSFVERLDVEKSILIVDESISPTIEDLSPFHSIYYLSKNKKEQNEHSNIRGNYRNLKSICEDIGKEYSIENHLILIKSVSSDEKENRPFAYSQIFKETLLTTDNEGNFKRDLIDYCRLHYEGNERELNILDQFEKDFIPEKSIWWFTRNSFIHKMIHRACRTEEVDILFKMRWIIQSINAQIRQNQFSKTVYRLIRLSSDQLKKFKENCKGFLSFGTFLDCSLTEPFSALNHSDSMETVLFRIQTRNGIEVKELRHPDSNIEVLLSFDNVYRIESVEEYENHYSIIHLILLDQENERLKELTNELRSEVEGPVIIIQMGKLLLANDDYLHADYFARLLFDDNSLKDNPTLLASLAAVHHLLGSQDHRRNNHRAARLQFEQSLKIFLSFIPEDNQILSATYNNIGSMFYQEDQHDQAILFHQKALQCQLKATTPDIDAIATYSGNIGAVYLDQKKYDQALLNYKRSLQILQQSTPGGESLPIALVYDRIASVYWRMEKPDQALPFYEKSLRLELKFLPENDHKISVSYFNLSTAYAKLDRLDEAIDAAEKSLQQLLKCVPPDHPEVKENTEQLEGLRRKKWLQQLYQ